MRETLKSRFQSLVIAMRIAAYHVCTTWRSHQLTYFSTYFPLIVGKVKGCCFFYLGVTYILVERECRDPPSLIIL